MADLKAMPVEDHFEIVAAKDAEIARLTEALNAPAEEMPAVIERGSRKFDAGKYARMISSRGGKSRYLDVKWRLVWLRSEAPDASIVTEHIHIDEAAAVFKATITLTEGGSATGYGSETRADFTDFIEKAETKAIGRALTTLGFDLPAFDAENGADAPEVPPMPNHTGAEGAAPQKPLQPRNVPVKNGGGITRQQADAITALATKHGIDADDFEILRDLLRVQFGKDSVRALSSSEAATVIASLQNWQAEPDADGGEPS